MNILVSGVSTKDGKRIAYLLFEDGERSAEAVIPECVIMKNNGFSDQELDDMITYMQDNLGVLKKQAAMVNPFRAMMKDD